MAFTRLPQFNLNDFLPLVLSGCRSLIGLMWLASLRWKLPPTFTAPSGHRSLLEWMQLEVAHPTVGLYADFVAGVAIPNFILFAWLTFLVELIVGLSLLLGLFTRWGAALGLLWSLNLAVGLISVPGEWPWSYLMLIMWHALFLVSVDKQIFGLDRLWQIKSEEPMPPKPWKTVSSREVYKNKWTRVREDVVELPNGNTTIYGVCELGVAVGVLPFVDDDHLVMVRQYRYVQQENHRWEIPTGGVHAGESLEAAAQRELMEEIGYRAGSLTFINSFYSSKSVCEEIAHLYLGRNLEEARAVPDETEFLEVAIMPFEDVLEMVLTDEIRESMTMLAVLQAAHLRRG